MKVAVFCGSSAGNSPVFLEETKKLGKFLAESKIDLVYGGGKVGLMGAVADAVLTGGGEAFGVIPAALKEREIAHPGLTELYVVDNMHARKARMASMADAFIALPGGAGTMDEIFEAWTWAQLGHHAKPCAFYNMDGFYEHLLAMIENMVKFGFLKPEHAEMLIVSDRPADLIDRIKSYEAPQKKWS